jgi:hypothetical protein
MTNHLTGSTAVEEKHSTYDDKKKKDRGHHTPHVPEEEVALRAYHIWLEHDCTHGHDQEDWLQAEQELHGHGH